MQMHFLALLKADGSVLAPSVPSSSFSLLPTAEKQDKTGSQGDPVLLPFSLHELFRFLSS